MGPVFESGKLGLWPDATQEMVLNPGRPRGIVNCTRPGPAWTFMVFGLFHGVALDAAFQIAEAIV